MTGEVGEGGASHVVLVGTRGSALARWQAEWVSARLTAALPEARVELVPIESRGDRHRGDLSELSGPGHFTSELEHALRAGTIDVAVHSLKDLPVAQDADLPVVAVPERADPADALVSVEGAALADLPSGARIGTSSPRRAALLRSLRSDVDVVPMRGNVDTRIRAVEEGRYDAAVLAVAGLTRLGKSGHIGQRFEPRRFTPAPGQGALAVQVRDETGPTRAAAAALDDPVARATTTAERALLAGLGSGCSMPVGAHAWLENGVLWLVAFAGAPAGKPIFRVEERGERPEAVGHAAAERLLSAGAARVLL